MFPLEIYEFFRSSHWKCFMKEAFLKIFVIHRKVADLQLHLKETPTEVFSPEYCEIFKNTYFEEHLQIQSKFINLHFISKRLIHVT